MCGKTTEDFTPKTARTEQVGDAALSQLDHRKISDMTKRVLKDYPEGIPSRQMLSQYIQTRLFAWGKDDAAKISQQIQNSLDRGGLVVERNGRLFLNG